MGRLWGAQEYKYLSIFLLPPTLFFFTTTIQ
jgi:hypothetical protein